jgi:hypothetical protein
MKLINWTAREPSQLWEANQEHVVVWGEFGCVRVSRAVGDWIHRQTRRTFKPVWLQFIDVHGALVTLRTRDVEGIRDTSVMVRWRVRAMEKLLEKEDLF